MELTQDNKVAFRIAHLTMIQGAITRMSGFSASAKTFLVTILAGLAAISLQADMARLGIMAMLVTIVLGTIDIYYMTLELRFRAFYELVESRDLQFSHDLTIKPQHQKGDLVRALNSTPVKLFYLPVFGACAFLIVYGLAHDWWNASERSLGSNPPRSEQTSSANTNTETERSGQLARPANKSEWASGRQSSQPKHANNQRPVRLEATTSLHNR